MRSNSTPASVRRRPRLTALFESMLRATGPSTTGTAAKPMVSVPRRLLIVKVHGLGDSVLIRLIIEQLRERNPDMDIGVLTGPATREILTMGTSLRVHTYSQKELSMRSAFTIMRDIRRAGYEAVLNFEQGSLAGTAFIGLMGIPIRLGFVPLGDNRKAKFLTHGLQLDESRSMWQSFVALARMVDPAC